MVSIESDTKGSRCHLCARRPVSRDSPKESIRAYDSCTLVDGNPCPPCTRATGLAARIIKAQNELERLLDEETELRKEINREHESLIHCFPPEITSYIFELSLPDDWHTLDERQCLRGTEIAAPLILGAVCKYWRTIAWSLPRLWTYLPIDYYIDSEHPSSLPSCTTGVAAEWLSRSGNHSLSISISPKISNVTPGYQSDRSSNRDNVALGLAPLMPLLNEYLHRCKYLDLHVPGPLFENIEGLGAGRSILDKLRILELDASIDEPEGYCAFLKAAKEARPSPTYVAFSNLSSVMNIGWENVTILDATRLHASEFYYLLKHSPKLQQCHVKSDALYPSTSVFDSWLVQEQSPVVQKTLQSLSLAVYTTDMEELLNKISLPALQSLRFNATFDNIPFENLIDLVTNCGTCRLTSLDLQGHNADNGLLIDLLRHTPLLRKLYFDVNIDSYPDSNNLFQLLGRTSTHPHQSFLPELKDLRISFYFSRTGLEDEGLVLQRRGWGHIADIFGPVQDLGKARRRPLSSLRVTYNHCRIKPLMDKDTLLRFLKIAQTEVVLEIRDFDGVHDILQLSKQHHGLI